MADVTDKAIQDLIRVLIREEVRIIVQEEVRAIVKEETADMRADVKLIKEVQGSQGLLIRAAQTDLNSLKTSYRKQAQETHRLGVLLEDLDDRFAAAAEAG